MLIDDFLPSYDFHEIHSIDIHSPPETIYQALPTLDLSRSVVVRLLFLVRGLPASCLTIQGLFEFGFVPLAKEPPKEFLLGVIGEFWKLSGGLVRFEPDSFAHFHKEGFAKAAWNFTLSPSNQHTTRVTTETRIRCTDERSRRRFRVYWMVVRPFSGVIRKEILKTLKRQIEQTSR